MADYQERIDELSKKLQELIQRQDVFAEEITKMKKELGALRAFSVSESSQKLVTPVPQKSSENTSRNITSWEDKVDLNEIHSLFPSATSGKTKSGTTFIKIPFQHNGLPYVGLLAESGKWSVENKQGNSIANGRFKDQGRTYSVLNGENKGKVIAEEDVISAISSAAGLVPNVQEIAKKVDENVPESTQRQSISFPQKDILVSPPIVKERSAIEKYIGENIITVIGIIIVLIGVVFGVKYSIDHDLISPLTRILLGYVLGAGIFVVGMKFKQKYEQFSAVLVSGSIAIMYFVTFAAYNFYHLMPQLMAFGMMVIFTAFIVFAAIKYNRQIIALIGLVGAYAVPFLLSNGSGNITALFSYITLINIGILIIGFIKNWNILYYTSFFATWLLYGAWFATSYERKEHFTLALVCGSVFFLLFYTIFLAYKLIKKENFKSEDVFMIVLNSFIFYGASYFILDGHPTAQYYLGVFTLLIGFIHFIVSVVLYKTALADRNLFYLTAGMVLVFITIAIPVQLEGIWVTMLWALEAILLFWIGRTKKVSIYEWLSYPVMVFALISLLRDWEDGYAWIGGYTTTMSPFLNSFFLTSLIVTASFLAIVFINRAYPPIPSDQKKQGDSIHILSLIFPIIAVLVAYNTFRLEIDLYWDMRLRDSLISLDTETFRSMRNYDYQKLGNIWVIIYSIVFVGALSLFNKFSLKSKTLTIGNSFAYLLATLVFLTVGLFQSSMLRDSYLHPTYPDVYAYGAFLVGIRYICFAMLAIVTYLIIQDVKTYFKDKVVRVTLELFLVGLILWVTCSELINLLELAGFNKQHKLGLSILCGIYAFLLVGIGIWKSKAHLRIAAFVLFGAVLLKLFFYDIAHLPTISKTIVFIALGLILLVISFLYNKYQNKMNDENK